MKSRKPTGFFAPREIQRFLLPITLSSILVMFGLILEDVFSRPAFNISLIVYGLIVIIGTIINHFVIIRTTDFRESYGWLNAVLSGIGLGFLPYVLPIHLVEVTHVMIPFGVIAAAIVSGRSYGYTTLLVALVLGLPYAFGITNQSMDVLEFGMPFVTSVIMLEAVLHIKNATQQHIYRLETINKVSRQLTLFLEAEKTIPLLDATIQEALEADTYFIGFVRMRKFISICSMMRANTTMEQGFLCVERYRAG